jgi:hypothetical protein
MPQGIYLKYYCTSCGGDNGEKVTEDFIKELIQNIHNGDMQPLYFTAGDDDYYDYANTGENGVGESAFLDIACGYDDDECDDCKYDEDCDNCRRLNWFSIGYAQSASLDDFWYSIYNEKYADSDEESCIVPLDGQSVIAKKYTTNDSDLAAKAIEYYIRTGKPYPGAAWIRGN